MTPRAALAVIGVISLFVVVTTTIVRAIARMADARRARHATRFLVGRAYWSPDMVVAVDPHLAGRLRNEPATCITQRLPLGWVPPGAVIDVRPPASRRGAYVVAAVLIGAWIGVAAAAYAAPPPSTSVEVPDRADRCGEERAAVKLGRDVDARSVALQPVPVTIAELVLRPRPAKTPEDRRATDERGTERTVYTVHGTITGYKLEGDGDLHVVIADDAGNHMIVELPAPSCAKPGAWGDQVASARAAFLTLLDVRHLPRPAAKLHHAAVQALITGVGFYDKLHGQTGVARNGVELHPVLAIEAGGGS